MPSPDASVGTSTRPLRVLLLTDEMEVGGTQRQMVHIARHLDRARFAPSVLFFVHRSFFVDELEAAGVPVLQIPKRPGFDAAFLRRLRETLRAGRFDVMHCFALSGEFWGALARQLLPRAERPALISSIRGTYEWYSRTHWIAKRWISAQSHRVVANSRVAARYAAERIGRPAESISIAYNGVEAAPPPAGSRAAERERLGLSGDDVAVLFVGRLVEHKDPACLLRAFARLADAPRIRLLVAGEGPLRAGIEATIDALSLRATVKLLGQRDDITSLIACADLVALPSLREGLSNVILEGMSGGRPVVASRAGGNGELILDNDTGLLFDIGDDAALAAAIRRLSNDPALRERLGASARERARDSFGIPSMVRRIEGFYAEAAASRRGLGTPATTR